MAMELIRETVLLDSPRERERTQMLLEGDIIVPDIKPDIAKILRADGSVVLEDDHVAEDRVQFSGELKVTMLYQAKKAEKLLCSMTSSLPFSDFIVVEGMDRLDQARLSAVLEHLEYRLVNDRKIGIKAVVTVYCDLYGEQVCQIVTDIPGVEGLETMQGQFTANEQAVHKKDRIVVKAELPIPAGKPNVWELLETDAAVSDKEVRPIEGKVQLRGNLHLSTLYTGEGEGSLLEVVEGDVPFNGYLEDRSITAEMLAGANVTVDDISVQVVPDADGEDRLLDAEITLGVDLDVMNPEEVSYLEDAYSLSDPLDLTMETITYPVLVGMTQNRAMVKDTVTLDTAMPDILQVFKVWGKLSVDEPVITENLVTVEGVVNLQLLYVAVDDNNPVQIVDMAMPFTQEIEVKGAKPGMTATVQGALDGVSFQMLTPREIEARANMTFDVMVTDKRTVQVITDAAPGAPCTGPAGANVILYVVQKGDTLWKIAKRYHTTVKELTLLNEIENPDLIYPGQKLLIIRRAC